MLSKNGLPNSLKAFFGWSTSLTNFTWDPSFESWCSWTSFLSWWRIFKCINEVNGFETRHELRSFFVNPIGPPTPLILPFSGSWLWSSLILEKFRLVFWTVSFTSITTDWNPFYIEHGSDVNGKPSCIIVIVRENIHVDRTIKTVMYAWKSPERTAFTNWSRINCRLWVAKLAVDHYLCVARILLVCFFPELINTTSYYYWRYWQSIILDDLPNIAFAFPGETINPSSSINSGTLYTFRNPFALSKAK